MVLDTGTAHTILSTELAPFLGFPEGAREGSATFETPDGLVKCYIVHIPSLTVLGHQVRHYLVGCKPLYSRLNVAAILGLDFFQKTDLLLAFTEMTVELSS